jgi:predicted phage terminase large subunit-like protein
MNKLFDPIDISHIPDGSGSDEIFKNTFWCNDLGSKAMRDLKNRREAEAMLLFGQTYCPDHFPSAHPRLHTDIMSIFFDKSSKMKAIAVPRAHSKSTLVSFLYALYCICFQKKKFIIIMSDSEDKAKDFIIRLRDELEHNVDLNRDFAPNGSFKTTDWSKTDFITSTGIRVLGKGSNQSVRGSIHLDTRPDLAILDDLETNETAGTTGILNAILTDIIPSMSRSSHYDICYIGTIIKDMAILHQMLINPEWISAKWECIDDNGEMIAPMLYSKSDYEVQKRMYQNLGRMSVFYAENHNNPLVSDDEATFKPEFFQHIKPENLPEGLNYYLLYDPAMPPSGRTKIKKVDRSAIIVLGTDSKQNWYVVKVYANRDTPMKNRELIYNLARKYPFKTIWMETISAQRGMYLELRNNKPDGVNLPLREIPSHSGSKEARIEQLQPFYESGRIYHVGKDDKEIIELERELLLFGRTPHDDRSDCLSFAINKVKYPTTTTVKESRAYDVWDKLFNKDTSDSWKVV